MSTAQQIFLKILVEVRLSLKEWMVTFKNFNQSYLCTIMKQLKLKSINLLLVNLANHCLILLIRHQTRSLNLSWKNRIKRQKHLQSRQKLVHQTQSKMMVKNIKIQERKNKTVKQSHKRHNPQKNGKESSHNIKKLNNQPHK